MINTFNALQKLYPQVVTLDGNTAYDADGNEVAYDTNAVNAKVIADAEAEIATKESALSKLTALGLTANEVKALLGIA
jgi:hypothetical protein